jgi:hypothetical protein
MVGAERENFEHLLPRLSAHSGYGLNLYKLGSLRPVSTQDNKHGIGLDRNKIEPVNGLSIAIFCSSLNQ